MGGKGLKLCRMHLGVNCEQVFAGRFTPKCHFRGNIQFPRKDVNLFLKISVLF